MLPSSILLRCSTGSAASSFCCLKSSDSVWQNYCCLRVTGTWKIAAFKLRMIRWMTEKGFAVWRCSHHGSLSLCFQFLITEAGPALPCYVLTVVPHTKITLGGNPAVLPAVHGWQQESGGTGAGTAWGAELGRSIPHSRMLTLTAGHSVFPSATTLSFQRVGPALHAPILW